MTADGVDFVVFAKRASAVEMVLFDHVDEVVPAQVVRLDPVVNRTGDYWHAHLAGIGHDQLYGYRVDGRWAPHEGLRFDAPRSCSTHTGGASRLQPDIGASGRRHMTVRSR